MRRRTSEIRLSELLARTVEEGDCLLWTGHASEGKFPRWGARPARRVVYEAIHGPLSRRLQVSAHCKNPLCVHPNCLFAQTRGKANKSRQDAQTFRANVAAAQRKRSSLTIEIVREIRASSLSNTEAGAPHGLHRNYVARIRRNEAWVDFASPFAGLGTQA
ncbi:MAG: hypothetical protein V4718_00620 [Pseudomonadota bacterium]